MIQDIGAHCLNNQYDSARTPRPDDAVISYYDKKILVRGSICEGRLDFLSVAAYAHLTKCGPVFEDASGEADDRSEDLVYLFSVDERGFFLALRPIEHFPPAVTDDFTHVPAKTDGFNCVPAKTDGFNCVPAKTDGFTYVPARELRAAKIAPQEYIFAAFTAAHLAEWYRRKRYCGACGRKLRPDRRERAMRCPDCGEVFYPRINPAVIVGVTDGDRLLVTRYLRGYGHNALVAGFTEIGETLEETVAREVMEETGLRVKNIRYYKSQPWGIASDLLAGFFCDVDGSREVRLDGQELRSAIWTPRPEITWEPPTYSLTAEMMKAFRDEKI